MDQKQIFLKTEGNQWFGRNKGSTLKSIDGNDEAISILKSMAITPKVALEIGCSNGARISYINKIFKAVGYGIDPSREAVEYGRKHFPQVSLQVGTADELPFEDDTFDLIIFGFCLYLCDRKDLFKIAYEADRVLKDGGYILIKDFHTPFPYKNKYSHYENVNSYKMDYPKLFTWNPFYTAISQTIMTHDGFNRREDPDERIAISVLQKNEKYAYPEEPFK